MRLTAVPDQRDGRKWDHRRSMAIDVLAWWPEHSPGPLGEPVAGAILVPPADPAARRPSGCPATKLSKRAGKGPTGGPMNAQPLALEAPRCARCAARCQASATPLSDVIPLHRPRRCGGGARAGGGRGGRGAAPHGPPMSGPLQPEDVLARRCRLAFLSDSGRGRRWLEGTVGRSARCRKGRRGLLAHQPTRKNHRRQGKSDHSGLAGANSTTPRGFAHAMACQLAGRSSRWRRPCRRGWRPRSPSSPTQVSSPSAALPCRNGRSRATLGGRSRSSHVAVGAGHG